MSKIPTRRKVTSEQEKELKPSKSAKRSTDNSGNKTSTAMVCSEEENESFIKNPLTDSNDLLNEKDLKVAENTEHYLDVVKNILRESKGKTPSEEPDQESVHQQAKNSIEEFHQRIEPLHDVPSTSGEKSEFPRERKSAVKPSPAHSIDAASWSKKKEIAITAPEIEQSGKLPESFTDSPRTTPDSRINISLPAKKEPEPQTTAQEEREKRAAKLNKRLERVQKNTRQRDQRTEGLLKLQQELTTQQCAYCEFFNYDQVWGEEFGVCELNRHMFSISNRPGISIHKDHHCLIDQFEEYYDFKVEGILKDSGDGVANIEATEEEAETEEAESEISETEYPVSLEEEEHPE